MSRTPPLSTRWLVVTAIVFLAGVFLHLPITDFCDWLAKVYGFPAYDSAVRAGFIALGLGAGAAIWLRPARARPALGVAATALLALVVIAHKVIVLNAVESVHYPQYALILVLLARAGIGLETGWLAATVLGAIDEGYQAVALPRGAPDYFDWNDVVLNGIGAAFGVVLVLAFTRFADGSRGGRAFRRRWAVTAAAVVAAALLAPPVWSPFWVTTPGDRVFHPLSASEASVVLAAINALVVWVRRRAEASRVLPG